MRNLLFSPLFLLSRTLRPTGKRHRRSLVEGGTVLYLQFERPLGCSVHGTPLIGAFQAAAPGARVIAAAHGLGAATLRHHPGIEHLIEIKTDPSGSVRNAWRAAGEIRTWLRNRNIRPDVIVQDASSRRGSWALLPLFLRLAPAIGFADAPSLYDLHLSYDPGRSLIDNNLRLVAAVGGSAHHHEPAVFFTAADVRRAEELLSELPPARAGLVGFVLQGSGGQRTGWHKERFAAVIRSLESQGYAIVFFGTDADQAGIEDARLLSGSRGLSLAGRTSIPEAAAVLCRCDLLITVDTGTMHLGRSVSVPIVVLGPSWQKPLEWLPLHLETVRILRGPDRQQIPPDYKLDEIQVADVLAAAEELLQLHPPSQEQRLRRTQNRLSSVRA